jgi:hypothetical protein
MNEKTNPAGPTEAVTGCGRAADLVAYLYGEAAPAEARDFRRHLDACDTCRDELAAFGVVRERVGEWRAEALRDAPAPDLGRAFPPETLPPANVPRVRSARAALREFFSLSPRWLRAGAAAAVLLVCALAALVFARAEVRWGADGLAFRAGVAERTVTRVERVEAPAAGGFTQEQVEAAVRERVRDELAAAERRWKEESEQRAAVAAQAARKPAPRLEAASNPNAPPRKRPAPRVARREQQWLDDDESLPRLSDLLGGVY